MTFFLPARSTSRSFLLLMDVENCDHADIDGRDGNETDNDNAETDNDAASAEDDDSDNDDRSSRIMTVVVSVVVDTTHLNACNDDGDNGDDDGRRGVLLALCGDITVEQFVARVQTNAQSPVWKGITVVPSSSSSSSLLSSSCLCLLLLLLLLFVSAAVRTTCRCCVSCTVEYRAGQGRTGQGNGAIHFHSQCQCYSVAMHCVAEIVGDCRDRGGSVFHSQ
jgi:hypothetical protein